MRKRGYFVCYWESKPHTLLFEGFDFKGSGADVGNLSDWVAEPDGDDDDDDDDEDDEGNDAGAGGREVIDVDNDDIDMDQYEDFDAMVDAEMEAQVTARIQALVENDGRVRILSSKYVCWTVGEDEDDGQVLVAFHCRNNFVSTHMKKIDSDVSQALERMLSNHLVLPASCEAGVRFLQEQQDFVPVSRIPLKGDDLFAFLAPLLLVELIEVENEEQQ